MALAVYLRESKRFALNRILYIFIYINSTV